MEKNRASSGPTGLTLHGDRRIPWIGAALTLAVFAFDVAVPLGYSGGLPYIIPILLGLWAPTDRYPLAAGAAAVALTVAGYFLSAGTDVSFTTELNRVSAIAVIAVTTGGVILQRRTAAARRTAEARNRAVLDSVLDAVVTIDERGRILQFNPAAETIFGHRAADVLGRNVDVLMPSSYREEHGARLRRYLETGERRLIGQVRETVGLRADGSQFPIEVSIAEAWTGGGRIFAGVLRDITEKKRQERAREALIAELETKNAELERFTYTVSHDLKSPLITIKGFLGTIEADAHAGNLERLHADVERIGRASDRMKELLDDLLELSRIGRIMNPPEDVPMRTLCDEVVYMLSGPLKEAGVRVEVADELPVVRGDRTRLQEVVQNLVENAAKFMGDEADPRVEIGARREAGELILFVRDNGVGVDPRYHHKVFELFERLGREGKGTGVGLALVKRIIEVHRGRIWVESAGVGLGATFCFTLPEARSAPPQTRLAS